MFLDGSETFISAILASRVKTRVLPAPSPLGKIPKISKNPTWSDVHHPLWDASSHCVQRIWIVRKDPIQIK